MASNLATLGPNPHGFGADSATRAGTRTGTGLSEKARRWRPAAARPALAVALVAVVLSGCASEPQLGAQWTDASLGAHSSLLRGARIMVACEAYDVAVRQVCQEQLAAQVAARGATPVFIAEGTPLLMDRALDGQMLPGARSADVRAVLVMTLTPAASDVSSGVSVGIGGFGFGRGGGGGVGVAAPIGGGRVTTGFAANGRVTDVASGRLVWTASAVASPSDDLNAQVGTLSKTVLDSADKAGLF